MSARSRPRPFAVTIAIGLLGVVALSACDDDSGNESARRRSTTTTTSTTAPTSSSSGATTTLPQRPSAPPLTPAPANSCGAQTQVITEAVEGSESDNLAAQKDQYSVQNCRMSQSELIWALVDLVPEPGSTFAPTMALMERVGATWTVRQLGTSRVSCDAPERARIELGLVCQE